MQVKNPVLKGFNPDPSLLRAGDDYYIATSTFEWFPGVCIHHSKDLVNWEIAAYALTDEKELDLTGVDAACGIWAPNLTFCDGLFYLTYTIVYTNRPRYKDTYNFLVTAPSVTGPWSRPVPLNRSGFDPSIFHNDDGRKYLVNMTLDHRADMVRFSGVDVQEYDAKNKVLLGKPVRVSGGTKYGTTEGPNITKRGRYYYLTMAEGGTDFFHCATVVRSESIYGPYEENPANPLITSEGQEDCRLKRAGHAQIAESPDGRWYMAHLCSRPVDECSILGRETAIQNIEWTEDGWFKLKANDKAKPEDTFEVPVRVSQVRDKSQFADFSNGTFPLDYMTLRQSAGTCGIKVVNGHLRIQGGCSPMSKYMQAFLARRQQCLECDFTAAMEFEPRHLNHLAGMMVYYNYDNHYYLKMSRDERGKCLTVSTLINQVLRDSQPVYLPEKAGTVYLKAVIRRRKLQYAYSLDNHVFTEIGGILDMRNISDERIEGNGFTGSMLGVNCCDCQGDGIHADFWFLDYKEYEEREVL
ncbi:glycoside hydrolase family 43 protein [Lacrimispora sp.]|uniref:glycoside hydrolase family 43 protein n=1 Tax=Lacrimispora sp. TaxID=2719234 RepID=UPI0032E39485